MQKTVVVAVTRLKEHSKYKRRYKLTKHYKAHDEQNEYQVGDKVIIAEHVPISRDKKWVVKGFLPGFERREANLQSESELDLEKTND
jgi:small subunit ribosomal protein S17